MSSALDPHPRRIPIAAALIEHGGRVATARLAFPDAPEPWIDLSTGINPSAYPIHAVPPRAWSSLPDPQDLAALLAAARVRYGASPITGVVAASGSQSLISLLPHVRRARRVAVLGFGYGEHTAAWSAGGASVGIVDSLEACADADVAVVVNPNNPDGRIVAPQRLAALAARLAGHEGILVVDEAFADTLAPEASLIPEGASSNVLVLRSFGKFFGLAGLRLGFALGDPVLCAALAAGLGPWAVSGPAIAVGTRALADASWQADTRLRLARDSSRLDALLDRAGLRVLGGTSLFRLARHPRAATVFDRLGRAGILVRPFADEPDWLRFGLPADEAAWDRLADALSP